MATCPICKKPLPFWRSPTSFRQAMWGGWNCDYCGAEIDRKGRLIKENKKKLKEYESNLYKEEYIREKARLKARRESK